MIGVYYEAPEVHRMLLCFLCLLLHVPSFLLGSTDYGMDSRRRGLCRGAVVRASIAFAGPSSLGCGFQWAL